MALQHAYAVGNLAQGRPFTWSGGAASNITALGDGRQDRRGSLNLVVGIATLTVDLGEARTVSVLALLHTNLARLPQVMGLQVDAADDVSFSGGRVLLGEFTALPGQQVHQALQFAPATKRYWRLTVTASAGGLILLGEAFLGSSVPLTRATIYGGQRSVGFRTRLAESDSGQLYGHVLGGPQETRSLVWADVRPSERAELVAMHGATFGGALPLLWLERYAPAALAADAPTRECLFGHVREADATWTEADFNLDDAVAFTVREASRGVGVSP